MILALLVAAAEPSTAVEAELVFAKQAQTDGQWRAFRNWSTDEALMFVPEPIKAHDFLKNRKDPPEALEWAPSESYVSCDGGHAINYGLWNHDTRKAFGFFTTVWVRQPDQSWKWVYDGGSDLEKPGVTPAKPLVRKASCDGQPIGGTTIGIAAAGNPTGNGESKDKTLKWSWIVDAAGTRHFLAQLWNGKGYDTVLDQTIKAN